MNYFYKITLISLFSTLTIFHTTAQNYFPAGLPKSKINLWLDATDANTITISAGTVTRWTDKANNLQANSPGTSFNPTINSTLLSGKNVIEFEGTKSLNIADHPLLDPSRGFNLAQVVYVHPDATSNYSTATDFRVGTYSRNENPLTNVPIGTPSIALRYMTGTNDNRYRVGLARNTSSVMIGANNASFPDLSGTWNLIDNYITFTNTTDSATVIQLNGKNNIRSAYSFINSTQSVAIGNRFTNYASVHWSIGETILTGVPLLASGKKILNCYLANKWNLQANLPVELQNLYQAPSTSFTNQLIGIGTEGATDSINGTGSNNGMGFLNVNGNKGFLRESGDYLLAADNAASGTSTIGSNFTRWNRTWYIQKTDAVGYGGLVHIFFDFNSYGIPNALDTVANQYFLLFNLNNSAFNTGNNYIIPIVEFQQFASSRQLSFLVDALHLSNGYYSIVYAPKSTPISNIPLLTNFSSPSIPSIPAPIINTIVAGNKYNYVFINTDSINYDIAYFKIFVGENGAAPVLIDSVVANNKMYAHYNLVNGNQYQYFVKAVYALGKESLSSNLVTATPGIYIPQWQTTPQFAGAGRVFMKAKSVGENAAIQYFFENVSGGGKSSGYQSNSDYTDVSLINGNTYTYRFKTMDSIKGVSTESAWSQPFSVVVADSAKGGFAYKFSFVDNNSIAVPNGIGPSLYSATTIDTTGLRFIKHAPAFGIHPRIYCNPEDSTSIKWRFQNTASGRALAKYIHNITVLLQLGFGNGGTYSTSASYARDTLGNPLLANVGFTNVKPLYDSLALGDIGVVNNYSNLWGGSATKLANILSYEAFECWLFKGTIDPVTNTSYTTRAAKLARAVSVWAQKALADNTNPLSFDNRDRLGSLQMAMIYDFLYDQMTVNQRDSVRMALVAIAVKDSMDLNLVNSPSFSTVSNWATFGYEAIPLLAIEGETGYTQKNENALQAYCRVVLNFLNYGFYEQTGGPVEGIGKNQINIALLTALAKRGYSMLGHPTIKAFAKKYYPAVLQPFGYSMVGTDLLGGTGFLGFNSQYVSAAHGGWKHMLSLDMMSLKWIFPNDTTIDFLWKNYVQRTHAGGASTSFSYYYQNLMGASFGQGTYWNFLFAAPFVSDYSNTPFLTQAQSIYNNNRMYFDSLGGFAVMRSGFDTLSAALYYHNRTDLGGHTYGNKNDIVYSALGRIWIPRVFSNANSNAPLSSGTSVASTILINNTGQSVDTTAAQNLAILPVPGKIVDYKNAPLFQSVAGDAKDAYSYAWSYLFGGYTGDNPLLGGNYTKVMQSLNSYRFAKYYSFDDVPLYNKLTQGNYSWAAGPRYYRTVSTPWLNGVVNKVFRTVAMVTDPNPYVIVADDVQKDNSVNNYKWIAQIANDLTIESVVVNLSDNNYRNDIIFREPSSTGNRRFLVRVLNNNGAVSPSLPAYIDSIRNPINNISPNNLLPRLVVESNSVDPQFKILLYAFRSGDALPITHWNAAHDRIFITNSGTTRTITFPVDSAGRTNIHLFEGILPVEVTASGTVIQSAQAKIAFTVKEQTNVAQYAIEKSINGTSFSAIHTCKATNRLNDAYSFIDISFLQNAYYRIKIFLKDGSVRYSNTVYLQAQRTDVIKVYPNPMITNQIQVQFPSTQNGVYHILLSDINGKQVFSKNYVLTNQQQLTIELPMITKGAYQLLLSSKKYVYKAKLFK